MIILAPHAGVERARCNVGATVVTSVLLDPKNGERLLRAVDNAHYRADATPLFETRFLNAADTATRRFHFELEMAPLVAQPVRSGSPAAAISLPQRLRTIRPPTHLRRAHDDAARRWSIPEERLTLSPLPSRVVWVQIEVEPTRAPSERGRNRS